MNKDGLLGNKYWGFPFSTNGKSVNLVGFEENIKQSIHIILGTRPGERVMNPEFGCRLWDISFEPNNQTILTEIRHIVNEALIKWEPRILINSIDVETNQENFETINVILSYKIKKTNKIQTLIYPITVDQI